MQDSVPGLIVGIIAGIFIGSLTVVPKTQLYEAVQNWKPKEPAVDWTVASVYPTGRPQYGGLAVRIADNVAALSDGDIRLTVAEPGDAVPVSQCFDAVSVHRVDACWSAPPDWAGKEPALALFGGAPFGPSAQEFAAWIYESEGAALLDKIYARHDLKSVVCGIVAAPAAGWFRDPIDWAGEIEGLSMRAEGYGAQVLNRLGATTQVIAPGDLATALERGTVDASEGTTPVDDARTGPPDGLTLYSLPGWQRRAAPLELLVNRDSWEALAPEHRQLIETACGDNFRAGLAAGGAAQAAALKALGDQGVDLHRLPGAVLARLEGAWLEIAEAEGEADELFLEVWRAQQDFRADYRRWEKLDRLPLD